MKAVEKIRTVSNHSSETQPHFTLFHFEVNKPRADKLHKIFGDDPRDRYGFKEFLKKQYMVILKGQQLIPLDEYREYGGEGKNI